MNEKRTFSKNALLERKIFDAIKKVLKESEDWDDYDDDEPGYDTDKVMWIVERHGYDLEASVRGYAGAMYVYSEKGTAKVDIMDWDDEMNFIFNNSKSDKDLENQILEYLESLDYERDED